MLFIREGRVIFPTRVGRKHVQLDTGERKESLKGIPREIDVPVVEEDDDVVTASFTPPMTVFGGTVSLTVTV